MSKPVVYVLGGFGGTTLQQQNPTFPNRIVWYSKSELSIYGPDNLQLAADGVSPGPLAGNPLKPLGMVDLGIYEPIMSQLSNDGWNATFIGYDWRLKLTTTSSTVAALMLSLAEGADFWVCCHSMGGLIARLAYGQVVAAGSASQWQRTVYLGSPQGGSHAAAMNLANFAPGGGWTTTLAASLGLVVRRMASPLASPASLNDRFKSVVASFPALYSLLPNLGPTYGPLDPSAGKLWDLSTYAESNSHVQQARLNDGTTDQAALQNALAAGRPSEVSVSGFGRPTPEIIADINHVNSAKGYAYSDDGDGSVISGRATLPGVKTLNLQGDHYDIVYGQAILSRITQLLRNGLAVDETVAAPEPQFKAPVEFEPYPPLTTIEFPFIQKRNDP